MKIEVDNVRAINKGTVIASFNLKLEIVTIRDCLLMKGKNGHHFISMPSRKYEELGETKYFSYVIFPPEVKKEIDEKGSSLVLDALINVHSMFETSEPF